MPAEREIPIMFISRPKECKVCARTQHVHAINSALRRAAKASSASTGVMAIAGEFGLPLRHVRRHRDLCLALSADKLKRFRERARAKQKEQANADAL